MGLRLRNHPWFECAVYALSGSVVAAVWAYFFGLSDIGFGRLEPGVPAAARSGLLGLAAGMTLCALTWAFRWARSRWRGERQPHWLGAALERIVCGVIVGGLLGWFCGIRFWVLELTPGLEGVATGAVLSSVVALLLSRPVCLIVLVGLCFSHPFAPPSSPTPLPFVLDVTQVPLTLLAPGTVINDPQKGATHIIYKGRRRIRKKDHAKLWSAIPPTFESVFFVITAEVKTSKTAAGTIHEFTDFGIGIGTKLEGKKVIISGKNNDNIKKKLSFAQRTLLRLIEPGLKGVLTLVRSKNFAIIEIPERINRDDKTVDTMFRVGVVLDQDTGRLEVAAWLVDILGDRKNYEFVLPKNEPFRLYTPPMLGDFVYSVDAKKVMIGGMITVEALAVSELPPWRTTVPMPKRLHKAAAQELLDEVSAGQLARYLRKLLEKSEKDSK